MVKKQEKCCENNAAKSDCFDFAAVFLQHLFAAKIEYIAVFNGWATFCIFKSMRSAVLFCCVWMKIAARDPLALKKVFYFLYNYFTQQ